MDKDLDYCRVFSHWSYFVNNSFMKLTKWSPNFDVNVESPMIPIWISFPNLHPHLFSPRILHDVTIRYLDRVWLGPENLGYFQIVEMEAFPLFCDHCKSLSHSDLNCPVLHPKPDVTYVMVANAILPPANDGVRLPTLRPNSNLSDSTRSGLVMGGPVPCPTPHPSHDSNVDNVLVVASSIEPLGPVNECANLSLASRISSHSAVENEGASPLGISEAPTAVPLVIVPIELISVVDLNAQLLGKRMDHNDWMDGSCSSQCGEFGDHVDPIDDDVYNSEVSHIGQKAFTGGKRHS
ncbi:hypothetical protein M5K25_021036 [Dendrobium thyrsiflorum]|uniref:DUF4283 domain-containing protein n=1 Tax=Dendrobium thyrsiflorum TaxID=117978 RepID=A0ABD0UBF6_DENTH